MAAIIAIGASEAEALWSDLLRELMGPGLRGVKRAISDSHEGLKKAVGRLMHATWQRGRAHFMGNMLERSAAQSLGPDRHSLRPGERAGGARWRARFARIPSLMDAAEDPELAHMRFPKGHWCNIHRTNALERRPEVVGIYPQPGGD